ncbi:DUF421 domain-containing protein [Deinococcus yavapaiensis]|uniref:Uncharacterized membrane protein YcaP (DUF421 family) n=1 Tax=Deinococcus yavapaiensis KR-236 TaxID=694435 RepID=A0A318SL33_9DEIO|nr:YetF domain-containing protein [Deinococcus yavapaiensis]PYE53262.1 uncharacterized membrane protein YcaP (DUF421 family) [Deinococcus yavapaiensis KR-236]
MSATEVVPFDWHRMFIGDAPWLFLLEIVFRTLLMYGWLLLLLRIVGRRGLAQLSIVEFAIVIALGSAVGDAPFYPDVPLLHAMLVVAVVVFLQWGLAQLINRSEKVETFMEGRPTLVVDGGRVNLQGLKDVSLSSEELFERLRLAGVTQLGEVRFAFVEQGGNLSIFRFEARSVRLGLPIVPPQDLVDSDALENEARADDPHACTNCGDVEASRPAGPCPRCGQRRWIPAKVDAFEDA